MPGSLNVVCTTHLLSGGGTGMVHGQPWYTKAGVEHWHGAAPDQDVQQLTIYEGDVKWLEPVTDAVYQAAPGK